MPDSFIEWDGRKFEFTGEYEEDVIPASRRVAMRNRSQVWYPVYECKATGERCLRADLFTEKNPITQGDLKCRI